MNRTVAPTSNCLQAHCLVVLVICTGWLALPQGRAAAQEQLTLQQLRLARTQNAHRTRRVIFNNDGCDCLYFPKDMPVTTENFLARRTTELAETHVDTLAYCSISSGFSYFTHNTSAGTVLTHSAAEFGISPDMRNIARDLIDQGTDCLEIMVDAARKSEQEIFWSMRMNDTHDAAHHPDKPYFLFPPLKAEHPQWLVGEPIGRTPVGRWSSVDYALPEVRDRAFEYIQEVVRNYDVDGVELDYFRHLCYFKSVAQGGVASQDEGDMITGLMRRVRAMTEQVGLQRGRPVLIAIRVPDSVPYAREMGLDIEQWLREGLVDLLVTTCYFRLNPWEYSVELGHRYDVPVYPCLSDSRVKGETRFRRASPASYRGRAMNAWAAGADGIHLFNLFDPRSAVFREVGDPQTLRTQDKLYFVTVRDGNPSRFLADGQKHRSEPVLTPSFGKTIGVGAPLTTTIALGEDIPQAEKAGYRARVTLHLELPQLQSPNQVVAKLNGHVLSGGTQTKGWLDLPVPSDCVKRGENLVEITLDPSARPTDGQWSITYDGDGPPAGSWRRDPGSSRTEQQLADGALRIADRGTESGDYLYWRVPWGGTPQGETVVETRVKVVSGSSYVIVSNGSAHERLGLWPDHIDLWSNRSLRYEMDAAGDFHIYRIVFKGQDLQVYVDDQLRIDARGKFPAGGDAARNELAFGAANSPMVGEAYWDYIRARLDSLVCSDIVVSVAYEPVETVKSNP